MPRSGVPEERNTRKINQGRRDPSEAKEIYNTCPRVSPCSASAFTEIFTRRIVRRMLRSSDKTKKLRFHHYEAKNISKLVENHKMSRRRRNDSTFMKFPNQRYFNELQKFSRMEFLGNPLFLFIFFSVFDFFYILQNKSTCEMARRSTTWGPGIRSNSGFPPQVAIYCESRVYSWTKVCRTRKY